MVLIGLYLGKNSNNKFNSWSVKKQFDYFVLDATNLISNKFDWSIMWNNLRMALGVFWASTSNWNLLNKLALGRDFKTKRLDFLLFPSTLIWPFRFVLFEILRLENGYLLDAVNQQFDKIFSNSLHPVIRCIESKLENGIIVYPSSPNFWTICRIFWFGCQISCHRSKIFSQSVNQQFDKIFSNSLHPVIRCIALDLGGVYFDGDIDLFYKYLWDKHKISIAKRRKDRLNP